MEDSSGRGSLMALRSIAKISVVVAALGFWPASYAADSELRKATEALLSGDLDRSSAFASMAIKSEPKSRLAHWIKAHSLAALSGRPFEINGQDNELVEEAQVRLDVVPAGLFPRNLVVMPKSADKKVPVLLADVSRSRIYVFTSRDGQPVLVDDFYTTIGLLGADKSREGDQKTPLGVYRIQFEIQNPRKDGFLGKLAMTLDYPNAYDNHTGRTGSGIWIHGVSSTTYVRPPRASDGCLAVSNKDLQKLRRYIRYNETQIVVVPRVDWLSPDDWRENAAKTSREFSRVVPTARNGGVFFVEENWPLVVTVLDGHQVERRHYFTRDVKGNLRRLLEEKVS